VPKTFNQVTSGAKLATRRKTAIEDSTWRALGTSQKLIEVLFAAFGGERRCLMPFDVAGTNGGSLLTGKSGHPPALAKLRLLLEVEPNDYPIALVKYPIVGGHLLDPLYWNQFAEVDKPAGPVATGPLSNGPTNTSPRRFQREVPLAYGKEDTKGDCNTLMQEHSLHEMSQRLLQPGHQTFVKDRIHPTADFAKHLISHTVAAVLSYEAATGSDTD
jgi:hypothetical protein